MIEGIEKIDGRWVHSKCSTPDNPAYTFPFLTGKNCGEYCKHCMSVYNKDGKGAVSTSRLKS